MSALFCGFGVGWGNLVTGKAAPFWHVYMIQASDGSLYTGITTDVERRFNEHLTSKQGAKYFQGRKPEKVVYVEAGHDRSSASKREAEIKRLRREQKLELMAGSKTI